MRPRASRRSRRDADDPPASARRHPVAGERPAHEVDAGDVDVEDAAPAVGLHVDERRRAVSGGPVHEQVQVAEPPQRNAHDPLGGPLIRDIAHDGVQPRPAERLRRLHLIDHDHVRALLEEARHDGSADPVRAARDGSRHSVEARRHLPTHRPSDRSPSCGAQAYRRARQATGLVGPRRPATGARCERRGPTRGGRRSSACSTACPRARRPPAASRR